MGREVEFSWSSDTVIHEFVRASILRERVLMHHDLWVVATDAYRWFPPCYGLLRSPDLAQHSV